MDRLRWIALILFCGFCLGCQAIDNDPVLGTWSQSSKPKDLKFPDMDLK